MAGCPAFRRCVRDDEFRENPSGVNWRGVFLIYGLCGLIAAALFWLIVR